LPFLAYLPWRALEPLRLLPVGQSPEKPREIYSKDDLLAAEQELDCTVAGGEETLTKALRGGWAPRAKPLRCRARHFRDAAVLGSEADLERNLASFPERLGPKRQSGARKPRGIDDGEMRCLRDLQVEM